VQLLLKQPFFGHLCLGLEPVERRDMPIPTMATDGRKLFYDPDFVDSLSPEHLRAILVHEVLHPALQHLWRCGTREKEKWNASTDLAINLLITEEGFELPQGVLLDKQFQNMSAEQVYALLPEIPKVKVYIDWHGAWGEADGEGEEGEGGGGDGKEQEGAGIAGKGQGDEEDKEGEGNGQTLPQIWRERIAQAATAARMQGKLPGSMEGIIEDILEPRLDWRILLRNYIQSGAKSNYRLCPPNKKHLWQDIYLPSITGERLEIAYAVDGSGSISDEEFREALAEVKGVTDQFNDYLVHFYVFDHKVQEHIELTPYEEWPEKLHIGRGGTSFIPVFDDIEENMLSISCLVIHTDGWGDYPDSPPDYPVIWLVTTDHPVPFGDRIDFTME